MLAVETYAAVWWLVFVEGHSEHEQEQQSFASETTRELLNKAGSMAHSRY